MRLQSLCAVIAVSVVAFGAAPAQAEDAGTVTGTGSVSLERTPDRMRVQVSLFGKGAGIKEALELLKKRTDAAKTQLGELGVEKESVKVDPPKVTTNPDIRIQRIELMLAQRRGKKAKKTDKSVTVTSTLTAEFKLDAKGAEALLLAAHPLQEKIRDADLGGSKEDDKLTPEQEELLEEAQANGYYDGSEQKIGEPLFLFVSRISDEDHAKALSDAFQKAKAQAARFARAAGNDVGPLRSLSAGTDEPIVDEQAINLYDLSGVINPAVQLLQQARARHNADASAHEALGAEAGPVKLSISVSATFQLKEAK